MIDPAALRVLLMKLDSQAKMIEPDWRMRSHRCRVCAVRLDGTEGSAWFALCVPSVLGGRGRAAGRRGGVGGRSGGTMSEPSPFALAVGELVTLPTERRVWYGIVEYLDAEHVRVRWDNGQIGLLYFDAMMAPNAYRLETTR